MDKVIYTQMEGKMTKVGEVSVDESLKRNFLITWEGMDWSGFRTLPDCEKQFPELEGRVSEHRDPFQVVRR